MNAPNILLIVADQERQRDWIPKDFSLPARQRLIDQGLEFTRYYTHTSPCSPAGSVKSYTIRIYALSGEPALSGSDDVSVNYTAFTAAMTDITLGYADLTFTN